jgi:hypothetical protein
MIKALKQIDTKNRDGVDSFAIKNFLNKNVANFEFSVKDVHSIFRRLKLNPMRVASFYQMIQALFPNPDK